jgi:hypothetical protein
MTLVEQAHTVLGKGDGTMKTQRITTTLLTIVALVLSPLFATVGCAKDTAVETTAVSAGKDDGKVEKKAAKAEQEQTAEKRKEIVEEATVAIRETQNALKALDEKKDKEAIAALEQATGKLTILLARDPELALAPASFNVVTYDLLADIDAVKAMREEIEDALHEGRVQQARHLIRNLASETVIRVSNIPLATYPDAIKQAANRIDDGKIEEAKRILQRALNTLVITDTIIPLPVVAAEDLLMKAESLTEKADRSKEEEERLAVLLKDARTELKFAQALGYGSKKDFKNLYDQLDQIQDKTKEGEAGSGYFTRIKGYLKDAFESSQHRES